jgi:hypothetical protein
LSITYYCLGEKFFRARASSPAARPSKINCKQHRSRDARVLISENDPVAANNSTSRRDDDVVVVEESCERSDITLI